ncbi:carbamoyltransferase HypF [Clostridium botulinum]|nr:carbamoyltransferase HypF [Clostridium botulinum]
MIKRKYILVNGRVQGVGFRPFVYRIACENNIKGYVKNTCSGVKIDVEGLEENIKSFIMDLDSKCPKVCKINEIDINDIKYMNYYNDFQILESDNNYKGETLISPDIAICDECYKELFNISEERRYLYSFINCTNCGPRFTIIKKLPYDRCNTTMKKFVMCNKCRSEYYDKLNRRFHAEPTCCVNCGPKLKLVDRFGRKIKCDDILRITRQYLKEGRIVALKGIGGFNLICDGKNKSSIDILRKRKNRPQKPLALMMRDIDIVNKYCFVNEKENEILQGSKKPIILLNKRENKLPQNIAFKNNKLGIVLPYSPLHVLLFDNELEVLVFTSGNINQMPIEYKNDEAFNNLNDIADYFLIHDREINESIDDSVVKVFMNKELVIRSGRGYAPISIRSNSEEGILALGSQLKNTLSISSGNNIFISPYVGDMENLETIDRFKRNLKLIKSLYDIKINTICYDMHPNYFNSYFLEDNLNDKDIKENNMKFKKIGIYHHHAHIASCMFDNGIQEPVIGIAFDGTGYGEDKKIWGGEFLICDYKKFKRVGCLKYMNLPGNDSGIKMPWKMGMSLLKGALKNNIISKKLDIFKNYNLPDCFNLENYELISKIIDRNINTSETSSMGRLFDGVASLLGFTNNVTYEGEAAIYLENMASTYIIDSVESVYKLSYSYNLKFNDEKYIIDLDEMILEILEDLKNEESLGLISIKFHNTITEFSIDLCKKLRKQYNINKVALSGGVFQNDILLKNLYLKLEENDFNVLIHGEIPCNDSGISLGQLIIANELIKSHN